MPEPARIPLAFRARTDRSIALAQRAVATSRARIEASLEPLTRVDLRQRGCIQPPGAPRHTVTT
ncbi:hypothetical protein [Methylobacterium planeticum]|uniref:Uncharacterized protein n=1 Tax=Methylobacterium planeticum TaxID=2615211 RepID=A0A6N6MXQ3_9HYPH|nr:hypothetical protein [Methylobacterium planeticum]KAB1074854.1 hypothetical protein F6X51_06965 [Methylobacterium planeticum]